MQDTQALETSERLLDMLMSDSAELNKEAKQDLDDYTRTINREGSFVSKIIEPSDFDRSRLVPDMHTDQPKMLFEYEQSSPFAAPVDYGTTPSDFIPRGRRYPVLFSRVQTRNTVIDLLEMQTYKQDVRKILGDNMTKDLVALRDHRFIRACNNILGAPGQVLPWVGKAMNVNMNAAISHSSFVTAKNTMRDTPFSIESNKFLANHLHIRDFDVMAVEELQGTEKSVDIAFKGFTEAEYSGIRMMFSIKKNLIPTGKTFWFGDQDYLGRYVQWIPPTMVMKKEDTIVQCYTYEVYGITIAHPGALAINNFLA
jgi:hypothetical protein